MVWFGALGHSVMDRGRRNLVVNPSGKKDKNKKNDLSGKNSSKKEMKKVIIMVLGEIDPAPLWRQI